MKALVVYDSVFGNTEQLAQAIAGMLQARGAVEVSAVRAAQSLDFSGMDLLVVGGPTHRMNLSPDMEAFLDGIPRGALRRVPAAAFDTRYEMSRWLLALAGTAAPKIARRLRKCGARLLLKPESFIVAHAHEGPLMDGELERARGWAKSLIEKLGA